MPSPINGVTYRANMKPISIGDVFYYWTVISEPSFRNKKRYLITECRCGFKKETTASSLLAGSDRSCGCAPMSIYLDRLEQFIETVPESGCWLWTGSIDAHGYGVFQIRGKHVKAHRAMFEA